MIKPMIAANWKLNKNPQEAEEFFAEFLPKVAPEDQAHFIFFLPAFDIYIAQELLQDTKISWGAQNVYCENSGAFTGENSPEVLKFMGGSHVLIGHSERRQYFDENDQLLAKKVKLTQALELVPMLCVGERLEQREAGATNDVIREQLRAGLRIIDWSRPVVIAYEPVWAIGTGKVATPEQANEAHIVLRELLVELASKERAAEIPILYGGSVKPGNASELSQQTEIDGFLVGGASLQADNFYQIYTNSV